MDVSPQLKATIRPETKLISCLAAWNGKDPSQVIPEAHKNGVGLYGFTAPSGRDGLVNLNKFMHQPISELKGDERNISALARSYHGVGPDAAWNGKDGFVPAGEAAPAVND